MPGSADYESIRSRHLAQMQAQIPEHVAGTRRPADRIAAARDAGLRGLLRTARARSPWHRDRLAGVDVDSFSFDDLRSLPVMTKADLVTHFDAIVTDPRVTTQVVERYIARLGDQDAYLLDTYDAAVSGGSSGVRAIFAFDWESWQQYFLALFRYIYRDPRTAQGKDGRPPLVVG